MCGSVIGCNINMMRRVYVSSHHLHSMVMYIAAGETEDNLPLIIIWISLGIGILLLILIVALVICCCCPGCLFYGKRCTCCTKGEFFIDFCFIDDI